MRTIFRFFLWTIAVLALTVGATLWWFVYRPLPQLDGAASLPGLKKGVTVERDGWGVPHIRAASLEDMAEAQGFVMAQDRLWQMDLLRRVARGQLSEIVGPEALPIDRQFRTLNFSRAADRDVQLMNADSRRAVDAYSRGVNHFIEQHQNRLPLEFALLQYKPRPWQASDSLVIAAYMYQTLTNTWEGDLSRAIVLARVGPQRAKELFSEEAAMDHFVVGDPAAANDGTQHSRADTDETDDDEMQGEDVLKASSSAGNAKKISIIRMMMISGSPPKYPANKPIIVPNSAATVTDNTATRNE